MQTPLKIGHKLSLTSVIVVVLSMCVFWLVTNYNTENILRQQADSLGNSIARQTAILVTELVLSNDLISMNVLLNQLTRDGAISQAAVLSVDDQVIAIAGTSVSSGDQESNQVFGSYVSPIALQGSLAGYVRINLDQSYIEAGVTRNFNFMLIALALLIVVAITVTMAVAQHFITLPLRTLAALLQNMRYGTIELSPFAERNDEAGLVAQEYNRLAHTLERGPQGRPVLPGFQQFDEDVSDDTEAAGVTVGSVLHIRITNYQALLQPGLQQENIARINACYFYLSQVAELYNGTVEQCAEDELIISFGARQLDDDHAFHGCCCALLFLRLMDKFRVEDASVHTQVQALEFTAGLHSGEMITGVFSPAGRHRYTIAGETIDIARRISQDGAANSLIVSEQALAAVGQVELMHEQYSEFFDAALDQLVCTYLIHDTGAGLGALLESQAEHLLTIEATL